MLSKLLIFLTIIFTTHAISFDDIIQNIIHVYPDLSICVPTAKMFDASGKLPSGLMAGNLIDFGNYDLCLDHRNKSEPKEQYCMVKVSFPMPSTLFNKREKEVANIPEINERMILQMLDPTDSSNGLILGWCLPKACPVNYLTAVLTDYVQNATGTSEMKIKLLNGMCQTKNDLISKYDTLKIILIVFLSITLLLIALSTIYDMYIRHYGLKPADKLLIAFSVRTNGEKLLSVSKNPDQLPCLNGIRFISMLWVIYGHRCSSSVMLAIINLMAVEDWKEDPINMYIFNAPVSVDSFFVLSGLLVAYGFCLAKDKGINFNIIMFYIHRYLRLTPVLAVLVWIHVSLVDLFGSGPVWPLVTASLSKFCKDNWWASLLYIQNYYNPAEVCMAQTWYLSVDMQLFILSPILLIPLWKWPMKTIYASGLLIIVSIAIPFAITYIEDLPAFTIDLVNSDKYTKSYYFTTHTRFGPWVMGFMLGYYLFKLKKRSYKTKLRTVEVVFGWIVSMGLLLTILFSPHDLMLHRDKLGNSFFNALHRHGWSLGLCWIIFACTQGYGGPVNTFLSWSVFQVLGKFTYTIYLVHLSVIYLITGASRTNAYFSSFNNMYVFWGDFIMSLTIAVCLTLAYESPMITIEKVLFKSGRKSKKPDLHKSTRAVNNDSRQD